MKIEVTTTKTITETDTFLFWKGTPHAVLYRGEVLAVFYNKTIAEGYVQTRPFPPDSYPVVPVSSIKP